MTYETRTMSILVIPEGEPSYSEQGTEVRIATEAGGEFVEVEQTGCSGIAMPKWCCACMGAGSARARRLGLIGHRDGMGWRGCGKICVSTKINREKA